ncbi:MAG TPA: ATP-binding protein [Burkholderiales bacterium]
MSDAPASALLGAFSSSDFLPQRVSLLYRLSGRDIPAILPASLVVAFGLWGNVADAMLAAWIVWLLVASLARLGLGRAYRIRRPGPKAAARWESYFCLASAAVGMAWGITVLFLYPERAQLHEILVPFLIGSVAMGLPATLAPSPKAFACLIAPILAPMIGVLYSQGGAFNTSAAILILVFSAVLLALYLSSHHALLETLRFGRENELLLEKLTRAKDRLDLALRASSVLIWEWDGRRGDMILEGRWAEVLGYHESTVRRLEDVMRLFHPEDLPTLRRALVECMRGATPEYAAEHRVRTPSGDWRWSLSSGRVLERDAEGRAVRMIGTNVDIERQKRAEAELLTAVQREKELSELKSKFLSMASHEFRTPLATILSSSELLERYAERIDPQEKASLLQSIESGAKRMNELINDVLTIGRAESGVLRLNPARLDLRDLCARVIREFRIAQGRSHVVRFNDRFDLPAVEMDERLLRHILENLLSNAAKYSPEGSEILVTLARRAEDVFIDVQDHGIGIPEGDQARLFESFHRASNVENRPGTGLGLAIVRKAVDLHGGSISFRSAPGKGTHFTVCLPVYSRAAALTAS